MCVFKQTTQRRWPTSITKGKPGRPVCRDFACPLFNGRRPIWRLCRRSYSRIADVTADFLSRSPLQAGEWEVFTVQSARWGRPQIDLFAMHCNAQVQVFFSLCPEEGPAALDALAHGWNFYLAYAFLPFAILAQVIRKIAASRGRYNLVAPLWPKSSWFSLLRILGKGDPVLLPDRPDLLSQQEIYHPKPQTLRLAI